MKNIVELRITTKDWSYGDIISLAVMLDKDSTAMIYWGDAKRDILYPSVYDKWTNAHHCYNNKGRCEPFQITLISETEDGILGVRCGVMEVDVNFVAFTRCNGLIDFSCSGMPASTDFNGCPNLKKLNCAEFEGEELPTEHLLELEELDCGGSNLKTLNLSANDKLIKLDCSECPNLTSIGISNHSSLTDVMMWNVSSKFSKKSRLYLDKIVERNNGIIYDDFTEYVNSKCIDYDW